MMLALVTIEVVHGKAVNEVFRARMTGYEFGALDIHDLFLRFARNANADEVIFRLRKPSQA